MRVEVLLFARARDLAGTSRLTMELPQAATINELRIRLAEMLPQLTPLLDRSAFAVDNEQAYDNTSVPPGAEVALLPPVSGG